MTSLDVIATKLRKMDNSELQQRWGREMFSEEALPIARAEFKRRGLEPPETAKNSTEGFESGTTRYIFLRIIRGISGITAVVQIIWLINIFRLFSDLSAVNGGMWAVILYKTILLIIFGSIFLWLRGFINNLHSNKHGIGHPAMSKLFGL